MGFTDVSDYASGKIDWVINGMPIAGEAASEPRAIDAVAEAPTCRFDETLHDVRPPRGQGSGCVVVNEYGIVLGVLSAAHTDGDRQAGEAMHPGPPTFRPGVPAAELARHLREHDVDQALLTMAEGRLVGIATRPALELLGPRR